MTSVDYVAMEIHSTGLAAGPIARMAATHDIVRGSEGRYFQATKRIPG